MSNIPTLMTASIHTFSPLLATDGFRQTGTSNDSRMAHQHRLQSATSSKAVLALVPANYHELLRDSLMRYATISKWQAHKAAGSLPSHLKSKVPDVHLTKGYLETADSASTQSSFIKKHQQFCKDLLNDLIKAKKDKIMFLERVLTPQAIFERDADTIKKFTEILVTKTKLPILKADDKGNLELNG
ncbi:hypothetical protein PAXINDRAFT_12599 [Paxillus involutus ATCC 200175]|uniref:Uncharacterized protein n=1 Tax=Paxillus involutus ATCC 200175 TaxID=664439 RepID=A0A0C9U5M6_PAXIN|nr:hypothetical protein PAXINDRAFT_12599 [Paxillus involutus ATCC 200175]